jgi:hypothetical protein
VKSVRPREHARGERKRDMLSYVHHNTPPPGGTLTKKVLMVASGQRIVWRCNKVVI